MKVRIKDIAGRANVSIATVSLVLNGKPGVSSPTRQKILKIARELRDEQPGTMYGRKVPKGTIKFLKIGRHGHTVNRDHDVFIADYVEGLSREAQASGYNLEIIPFITERVDTIVESMRKAHGIGLVVLATELSYQNLLAFAELDCPVIVIDSYYEFVDLDFVDMDNADSVFQIVSNLVQNGHRDIGFLRSPIEVQNFRLREAAFVASLSHYGIPRQDRFIFSVDSTFDGAYHDTLALLENQTELPTALFASNDIMAYGCIKALKERGLRIPQDISIIGFDDLPMSAMMDPPLTTMLVNKRRIGETAMKLMISRLETDPQMPAMKVLIGGELVIRQSVLALNRIQEPHLQTR
ncbi:MAG: LacI family DNA-binding transcriptional regulator [Spirochaetales bacterium]|nr:LacI family DNA-binding transcriptional regulator [Spirochaetales bacterium]